MKRTSRKKNPWADHYTRQARKDKFAARSVYKLQEIQKKHRILNRGARVLDLGCAPGSWLQFAAQQAGANGRIVGIDLTPVTIAVPDNVTVITADVADLEGHLAELGQTRFDVVLSDMAPATTGCWTAWVTSVCPPATTIWFLRQASPICRKIAVAMETVAFSAGSSTVGRKKSGVAPVTAKSLTQTLTA